MDITKFKTMLSDNVIRKILNFMQEWDDDCTFTSEDVARCEDILSKYLDSLAALSAPTDRDIMNCVKDVVLELNQLSEDTDYAMIETDERENICELIQSSAVACGLQNPSEDITEKWREW